MSRALLKGHIATCRRRTNIVIIAIYEYLVDYGVPTATLQKWLNQLYPYLLLLTYSPYFLNLPRPWIVLPNRYPHPYGDVRLFSGNRVLLVDPNACLLLLPLWYFTDRGGWSGFVKSASYDEPQIFRSVSRLLVQLEVTLPVGSYPAYSPSIILHEDWRASW